MQDRKHCSVVFCREEFVKLPAGGKGSGLGLAVAYNAGCDKGRVVQDCAECVGQGIAQLAPFVDRARGLGGHMAWDSAREAELLEKTLHSLLILCDVGVDLLIAAIKPVLGNHGVSAVPRAGEVNHVQILLFDDPVQVCINEVLAWACSPVAYYFLLDMFWL